MPEADTRNDKEFHENVPAFDQGFFLKGSGAYDWGMKNRLARIFRPTTGRTVMLAIDHGYFQGPTTGLERVDLDIVPIATYADALMLTRGMLRSEREKLVAGRQIESVLASREYSVLLYPAKILWDFLLAFRTKTL